LQYRASATPRPAMILHTQPTNPSQPKPTQTTDPAGAGARDHWPPPPAGDRPRPHARNA
jgi:hypothetical protein